MNVAPTSLERAFTLARTGDYTGVGELRTQLHSEGYEASQLSGPTLLKQLRTLCEAARQPTDATRPSERERPGDVIGEAPRSSRSPRTR